MPQYEVMVSGEFCAAHQLRLYDGRLEPLHGHNWKVEVRLTGPRLNSIGVLVDFTLVRAKMDEVLAGLNDRFLNDLPTFSHLNPSAENVARYIYDALIPHMPVGARLSSVRVTEAVGCAAAFHADEGE